MSDLLRTAAGEPQRPVTVEMVRRRAVRRRTTALVSAVAAVAVVGGVGAAVAVAATGQGSNSPGGRPTAAGVPSFYLEQLSGPGAPVIRSRITGAVTATVRCPAPAVGGFIASGAAASHRTFFIACDKPAARNSEVVTGSWVFRFRLTAAGRVRGYTLVRGGAMPRLRALRLAVTADGSRIAVTVSPGTAHPGSGPGNNVLVINARTGARAVWRHSSGKPGTISYPVGEISLTANGRELVFLTQPRCIRKPNGPRCHVGGGEQVRALAPASRGGQVNSSRLLVRQASIMRLAVGYINDAVISPDGSRVTLAEVEWPMGYISIAQASTTTGRQVAVAFRMHVGDGFSYGTFAADPSGRFFLLDAGPAQGPERNGWIGHGRFHPLKPFNVNDIGWEAW